MNPNNQIGPIGNEIRLGREPYKRWNKVVRVFQRLKGFRCVLRRFAELDLLFAVFGPVALIAEAMRPR